MRKDQSDLAQNHAFVVRIWWERGLSKPNGRPLWRGQVQDAAGGQTRVFQTMDEMVHFICSRSDITDECAYDKEDQP